MILTIGNGTQADWKDAVSRFTFAYQPIVDAVSGGVFGYEALLRDVRTAGFLSIGNVFDRAFIDRSLHAVDLGLLGKAFNSLAAAGLLENEKIFYNIDGRLLSMGDYRIEERLTIALALGVPLANVVFEISERFEVGSDGSAIKTLQSYRGSGIGTAIDDYGTGFAGLKLLYDATPDFVKVDRYFIEGMEDCPRKRYFVESITAMAHELGAEVIAEGVGNAREADACREAGCDYLQGFGIAMPDGDIAVLRRYRESRGSARTPTGEAAGESAQLPLIAG
jgi:EAL domain-containing protein (putative c-di-GMP-specific phosphodiesterase class I)